MNSTYKPKGYNSLSPYFIVNDAGKLIDLIKKLFDARELRRYDRPDGSIMHAELQIDDSVIMISNAGANASPHQLMVHIYVQDVDATYKKALDLGFESLQEPKQSDGDPDKRAGFKDFAGNQWYIATQLD